VGAGSASGRNVERGSAEEVWWKEHFWRDLSGHRRLGTDVGIFVL
jgi:hypothetical protein